MDIDQTVEPIRNRWEGAAFSEDMTKEFLDWQDAVIKDEAILMEIIQKLQIELNKKDDSANRIEGLEVQCGVMRRALQPFADLLQDHHLRQDRSNIILEIDDFAFTVGDLLDANEALSGRGACKVFEQIRNFKSQFVVMRSLLQKVMAEITKESDTDVR